MHIKLQGSIISGVKCDYKKKQLHRIFEENLISLKCGKKSASISNDRAINYDELNRAANRMAAILLDQIHANKLQPNQDGDWIIAICMPPSNDFIVTLLAILKTGAAYLPMVSTFPQNRIDHILQEAKPAMVIYDGDTIGATSFGDTTALSFAECKEISSKYDWENISDGCTLQAPDANNLALVLYTSGSTGIPKGVRLSHAAILNRLQLQWEQFPFSSTEQFCVFKTVVTFVDSVLEIWGTILARKTIVIVPKDVTKDPSQLVSLLQKYEIERIFLVPTLLKSILIYLSIKRDANLLRKLKLWICSGETLPISLANEFFDYFAENEYMLCNFYGCTETMGDVTYLVCRSKEQLSNYENSVPIGVPFFNTTIYILDSDRNPVGMGETGELFVSGPSICQGYVNGRDKHRFIENFLTIDSDHGYLYRTGDYASVQEDGIIHYEGRTDSQVKVRGHRIDLSEIQKHLLEIGGVEKAAVLYYHDDMEQTILAFVSASKTIFQVENVLRSKLPDYMVPQLIAIDEMPLLVNGKIDRQALLRMYKDMNNNESAIDHDFNGVSQCERQKAGVLFDSITEVLGRSTAANLSLESNFYAMGGNSLNSIYTIAKLRERGYAIEITDFISAENLKEILNCMKEIHDTYDQTNKSNDSEGLFTIVPLKPEHKEDAIHILALSFTEKNAIRIHLKPRVKYSEFAEAQRKLWQSFLDDGLSFVIKDRTGRIVGVCLNHFLDFEQKAKPHNGDVFSDVNEYYRYVTKRVIMHLPSDKPILESSFLATHECLSAQENVIAATFIENETIRIAKERNFGGVFGINTNALTQQLATHVLGYKTLLNHQVNQLQLGDRKPFATVPDSVNSLIQFKAV